MADRTTREAGSRSTSSLHQIVLQDLRQTDLRHSMGREFKDLYRFYLDEEDREKLARMGRVKRAFWLTGWLLKSLVLRLSPQRRLMLLAALVVWFLLGGTSLQYGEAAFRLDLRPLSFALVLVVLMLELKDKLLARDEIQVARQVQLALLPRSHPQPDGWALWSYMRPANDVGGDLVDYIQVGSRLGIALGDVAGKGLGAALLMSKLQATLRALAPECRDLAELGARLNAILHRDGLDNRFATLFYCEIEPDSSRVRFLNAGHNPAFVLQPAGGADQIEALPASALPLGMIEGTTYEEGVAQVAPGAMLVAYSDGLSEATNESGVEYGAERLRALLPRLRGLTAEDAGIRLIEEVNHFLGEERPGDDLSLLVLMRLG
jgi:hypothetical protein